MQSGQLVLRRCCTLALHWATSSFCFPRLIASPFILHIKTGVTIEQII